MNTICCHALRSDDDINHRRDSDHRLMMVKKTLLDKMVSSSCLLSRPEGTKSFGTKDTTARKTASAAAPLLLSQSAKIFCSLQPKKDPDRWFYGCYVRLRLYFIFLLLLTGSCDGIKNTITHPILKVNNIINPIHHKNSLHDIYDDHRLVAATEKTLIEHDNSRLLKQNCVDNQRDLNRAIRLKRTHIDLCSSHITIKSTISVISTYINVTCNLNITNGVKCMLDSQGLSRHLYAYNATIYFHDIVFINGYTSGYGGATYINRSSVSMYRCDFMNNSAFAGGGGAIYSSNSSVILTGGEAKVAVAEYNKASYGGFLEAFSSTISITNHMLVNNSATVSGGVIYIGQSSTLSTYQCDFMNNSAVYGGAIISSDSTLIMTGGEATAAVAENNKATYGGFLYSYTISMINITQHLFRNNSALQSGGVIYIDQSSTLSTYKCNFMNNSAVNGGVIYSSNSTLILTGTEAEAAMAENNKATYGGFLIVYKSIINITNHLFRSNSALQNGGAIDIDQSSTLSAYRCDFMNNSAEYGGAIASFNSTLILTGRKAKAVVAEHNQANSSGGFLVAISSTIDITNHLFRNNSAAKAGGVHILQSSTLSTYQCDFMNNSAEYGGAIASFNSTLILTSRKAKAAAAENNQAMLYDGGFLVAFGSTINIINHLFLNNSAPKRGGAIVIDQSSTLSAYRCDFMNNSAAFGGAIASFNSTLILTGRKAKASVAENNQANSSGFLVAVSSTINITSYFFINNAALEANGGGGANIHFNGSSYYENVAFQNNSASLGEGGAFVLVFEAIALRNVVFKDNTATNGTIRSFSSQIDLNNYSFLSSDPTMGPCNLFVSQYRHTFDELIKNYFNSSFDDGLSLVSCINFPTLIAINNRRLDTKSIQAHSHEYATIVDRNDQMYPSDHLFLTNHTSSETYFLMRHNNTPRRMISSTCVSSSAALRNAVQSAKPGTPTTIKVCTGTIALGSRARRLQYGNSSLPTNILDGVDISNKNIIFVCSRKRRGKANRCTLDAGGVMRHFYGSDAKAQFRSIRFINGYHQGAGGALLINSSDVTLTSCSFSNNTALSGAGAVFVNQTRFIINGMETNVSQNGGSGAPIEVHSSSATVQNVAFADNTMTQFGDGIFMFDSNVDLSNLSFNQSSSNVTSNCSLFVSIDPTNPAAKATCVAL